MNKEQASIISYELYTDYMNVYNLFKKGIRRY